MEIYRPYRELKKSDRINTSSLPTLEPMDNDLELDNFETLNGKMGGGDENIIAEIYSETFVRRWQLTDDHYE